MLKMKYAIWIGLSILLISAAGIYRLYHLDMAQAKQRAKTGSRQINTACGWMEYSEAGSGIPVLVSHAAGGGYDQGLLIGELMLGKGYRLIAPSRFGYLGTVIPDDPSNEAQADAYACILDALGIEQVVVLVFSAGGPSAIQFAIRHPQRTQVLILGSAISFTGPISDETRQQEEYAGQQQDAEQFLAVIDLLISELHKRAFVYFDQRGTGYSQPSLKCHGEDWEDCYHRLTAEGIDVAAYNTLESVADINDIRLTLGYDQINLLGGSYGTRLALETMRRYPDMIRAVVLDGVAPPQIDWAVEMVQRYDDALQVLFDQCSADPACNTAYPDLSTVFYRLVNRLNTQPMTVPVGDHTERVDGDDLRETVWNALYDSAKIRYLPRLIWEADQGNPTVWGEMLAAIAEGQSGEPIAWGMHYSVECAERWAFETQVQIAQAASGLPPVIRESVVDEFNSVFRICQQWEVPTAPAIIHTPVHSDLPTLLLSGALDPGTPPAFANLTAQTLTHAYNVVFPFLGHCDGFTSLCYWSVISQFLDEPLRAPDSSCTDSMDGAHFVIQSGD